MYCHTHNQSQNQAYTAEHWRLGKSQSLVSAVAEFYATQITEERQLGCYTTILLVLIPLSNISSSMLSLSQFA